MHSICVGSHWIGGARCFVAAEIGINHNGDMALAHRMIDEAAGSGVDAVKFQNYETESFLSDRLLTHEYISDGKATVEAQFDMFKRCELSLSDIEELIAHCKEKQIVFFSTPTSTKGIEILQKAGAPLLKNGSDFLLHLPLIRAMAKTGLPSVLSTGMANLSEIDEAVRTFREAGGRDLILLHCTSSYPTAAEDVHLRKIPTLAAAFGCPVGFSDHTDGTIAATAAVALGASFVEKHFTLDKNLPGPDHRFSADPQEMQALVKAIRFVEEAMGTGVIGPTASESLGRRNYRISCVAASDLEAGRLITKTDIAFRRPGTGALPRDIEFFLGRRLIRPVKTGTPIQNEDF